jgi:hypothetical protein
MLGDCYEYDMKSSVVAWKLGYAQTYLDDNNLTHSYTSVQIYSVL